jgi:hypothetical protein
MKHSSRMRRLETTRSRCRAGRRPTVDGLRLRKKESGPSGLGKCGGLLQPRHGHRKTRVLAIDRDVRKCAGGVVEALGGGSHGGSLGKLGAVLKHWPCASGRNTIAAPQIQVHVGQGQ